MINRKKYCIANFKMNLGVDTEIRNYFRAFFSVLRTYYDSGKSSVAIIISPPFTVLQQSVFVSQIGNADNKCKRSINIAAQNVNGNNCGAFTGEVSVEMLFAQGIRHVIVGHSERRAYFNETNEEINKKNQILIRSAMTPIFCIGETLEQRQNNLMKTTLQDQLSKGLNGLVEENNLCSFHNKIIIAYEPVWAIGTGETASSEMIIEAHQMIRNILNDIGFDGEKISILYGGSVNRNNAKELIELEGVDGFLIGGASLDAFHFCNIYNFIEESI